MTTSLPAMLRSLQTAVRGVTSSPEIRPFVAIAPQLSDRIDSCERAFARLQSFGPTFAVEEKYDGIRLMIHVDEEKVQFVTRNAKDFTSQFSPFVAVVREHLRPEVKSIILDGELVLWDTTTGTIDAFGRALTFANYCKLVLAQKRGVPVNKLSETDWMDKHVSRGGPASTLFTAADEELLGSRATYNLDRPRGASSNVVDMHAKLRMGNASAFGPLLSGRTPKKRSWQKDSEGLGDDEDDGASADPPATFGSQATQTTGPVEVDPAAGEWRAVGKQMCFIAFDCVYINGNIVVDEPLRSRRSFLEKALREEHGVLFTSPVKHGETLEEVVEALDACVEAGNEGVMLKPMDSPYIMDDRKKAGWLKLKPEYVLGVGSTLDLLVIGADRSTGRNARSGTLSSFLLACAVYREDLPTYKSLFNHTLEIDEEPDAMEQLMPDVASSSSSSSSSTSARNHPITYLSCGRVGTGYGFAELAQLQAQLQDRFHPYDENDPPVGLFELVGTEVPEYYIEPKDSVVFEVKVGQVVRSGNFSAKHALRFPRVAHIRYDRDYRNVMSLSELVQLAQAREGRAGQRTLAELAAQFAPAASSADHRGGKKAKTSAGPSIVGAGWMSSVAASASSSSSSSSSAASLTMSSSTLENTGTISVPWNDGTLEMQSDLAAAGLTLEPSTGSLVPAKDTNPMQVARAVSSMVVCVLSGTAETSVDELGRMARDFGLYVVNNAIVVDGSPFMFIVGDTTVRASNVLGDEQSDVDVVRASWLIGAHRRGHLRPPVPVDYLRTSKAVKEELALSCDCYGDSYTAELTMGQLERLLDVIPVEPAEPRDWVLAEPVPPVPLATRAQMVALVADGTLTGGSAWLGFRREYRFAFPQDGLEEWRHVSIFFGAEVADTVYDEGVTHAIVDDTRLDDDQLDELLQRIPKPVVTVGTAWLQACMNCGEVDMAPFIVEPVSGPP